MMPQFDELFHSTWQVLATPFAQCLLLLAFAIAYSIHFYLKPQRIPGPRGVPVFYSLFTVLWNYRNRLDWVTAMSEKYGPVLSAKVVGQPRIVAVASPEVLEFVLKTEFEAFEKGAFLDFFLGELLGNGIFNSDGHIWLAQRKTASHIFNVRTLRDYMTAVFGQHCEALQASVSAHAATRHIFNIQDIFYRFTLDSVGEIAFGVNINSLERGSQVPFARAFDYCQATLQKRFYVPGIRFLWPLAVMMKLPIARRVEQEMQVIEAFAAETISAREKEDLSERHDLLSRFMAIACDDNGKFDQKYLRDVIMNFTIAGRDTTAAALSWAVYEVCLHPQVQQKMVAEIRQVLATNELSYEVVMHKLPYTQAIIKETLRLHPSVPVDFKMATRDIVLPGGFQMLKGEVVMYMPYAMGRRTDIWGPTARDFNPDRWLEMEHEPSAFKYPAFNAGHRLCLGKPMALLEATMVLAFLYKSFTFKLVPNQQVTYELSVTLPIKNGLWVTAERVVE